MIDLNWFGFMLADTMVRIGRTRSILFVGAQIFNRRFVNDQHCWGVGICQIGQRHLFYVGYNGVSLLFLGRTR